MAQGQHGGCVHTGEGAQGASSQPSGVGSEGGSGLREGRWGLQMRAVFHALGEQPSPPAPGSGVRRGWARAWPLEMGKLRPGDVQSLPRASSSFPRWPETAMKHQCDPTFLLGTPARRPLSWGHPQVSSLAHACAPHGSQAGEGAGRRPSFQGAHLSGAQEEGTLHRGALSSQSPGALLGLV